MHPASEPEYLVFATATLRSLPLCFATNTLKPAFVATLANRILQLNYELKLELVDSNSREMRAHRTNNAASIRLALIGEQE